MPGIIEWPAKITKPLTTDIPCSTLDIYPTIVAILGLKVSGQVEPLDGISLLPLIEDKMAQRPKPIPFWQYPAASQESKPAPYLSAEALTGTWRTFRNDRHDTALKPDALRGHAALIDNRYKLHKLGPKSFALYDLVNDPGETKDLAREKPALVERMAAELRDWQLSVERSLTAADYPASSPSLGK